MKQKVQPIVKKPRVTKKLIVQQRMQWLYDKHRTINAKIVVRDAEDKKSPLHSQFIWDDKKAGQLQRLEHARQLIASVELVVKTTHRTLETFAYVRNPRLPANVSGYIAVRDVIGDKKLSRQVIDLEIKQVLARLNRLKDLAEPLGQRARVQGFIAELNAFAREIAA